MPESGRLDQFQRDFADLLSGRVLSDIPTLRRAAQIHRNTAMRGAMDALAANFPVLQALFGEEAFEGCAAQYYLCYPPTEPRLNTYGVELAAFLTTYGPAQAHPYFVDVARLEYLYVDSLFAADAPVLNGTAFAATVAPNYRLDLHPATRFAKFETPAVSIWQAHQASEDYNLENLSWRMEIVLITRPGLSRLLEVIDPSTKAFLGSCARGESVAEAAQLAMDAGADLQSMFQTLITAGAFAARSGYPT
jgi:hypothetical protein